MVREQHQNLPFNSTLGRPVVLYPDPDKDPTRDAVVQALWEEFDAALDGATHVIVIGHSLRDSVLVAKLRAVARTADLAVCVLGWPGEPAAGEPSLIFDEDERERVKALLPTRTTLLPGRFGPSGVASLSDVSNWIRRTYGGP